MNLKQMIEQLNQANISDSEIARRLGQRGVQVNQSTICRIRNGRSTRYEVGRAIEALRDEVVSSQCPKDKASQEAA